MTLRADHVGSLQRPPALLREIHRRGRRVAQARAPRLDREEDLDMSPEPRGVHLEPHRDLAERGR
jgi:hypothetical protein